MEDCEEQIEKKAIKLPWKPMYNPEVSGAFKKQFAHEVAIGAAEPEYDTAEYWYIEIWRVAEIVQPHVDAFLNDPEKMAGYQDDAFHAWEPESIYLLNDKEDGFPNVLPPGWSCAIEGTVSDEDCLFMPYDILKDGGYLLHTREEYLRIFMEFALAAQTANPRVDAPPALTAEHGPTLPEV